MVGIAQASIKLLFDISGWFIAEGIFSPRAILSHRAYRKLIHMFTPEIEVVANAVAQAIKSSKKFGKAEFDVASAILAKQAEESKTPFGQFSANIGRISNVSAVRQELEQSGILPKAQTTSAFTQAVVIELKA